MDLNEKEKELRTNAKWIQKNIWAVLIGFILGALAMCFLFNYNIIPIPKSWLADISQTTKPETVPFTPEIPKITCEGGMFMEKLDNWKIRSFNQPDKDGFYCPRSTKKFLYSNIWYKNPVSTDFDSIEFRYKLINKDNNTNTPPSLILSLSQWEGSEILRFYVPQEKNWQIVGFEKIVKKDAGFSMEWEKPKELDEPIEYGTESELKMRIRIIEKNKVRFDFNLKYISALSGKSVENGFSYEVNLPVPNPESELSKLQIGFGTFQKNCIKPISYKFCY